MKLSKLLEGVKVNSFAAPSELEITGISMDSRTVAPGEAFLAIPGFETDGHKYIPAALERGASVILCQRPPEAGCPYVLIEDTRKACAILADNFYGHPSRKLKIVGVTGTKGKTTVTYLIKHILEQSAGAKVGLLGTNQDMIGDTVLDTHRSTPTTPDPLWLHKLFARMRDEGCLYCVMEVSSHALSLGRVDEVRFEAGVFTNLTREHLDFHKTMEAYRDAKAILFERCKTGLINTDDGYGAFIFDHAACPRFSFGLQGGADYHAADIRLESEHIAFRLHTPAGETFPALLHIPGRFSVYNALAAISCCAQLGIAVPDILKALASAEGVKGRVETVPVPAPYTLIIDYAHSPDSLENVLCCARGFAKGRLIVLFGAGGDRDTGKRPIMGEIAARLADVVVVTSDNPRTEQPSVIIDGIMAGIRNPAAEVRTIENRREAIFWALENARKDDVVILAGKGHETYQEINHVKHHFDEREVVAEFFTKK